MSSGGFSASWAEFNECDDGITLFTPNERYLYGLGNLMEENNYTKTKKEQGNKMQIENTKMKYQILYFHM